MRKTFLLFIWFLPFLLQAQIQGTITVPEIQSDLSSLQSLSANIKSKGDELAGLYTLLSASKSKSSVQQQQQEKIKLQIDQLTKNTGRTEDENNKLAQLTKELARLNSIGEQINSDAAKLQKQIDGLSSEISALDDAMDKLEQKLAAAAVKEKSKNKGDQKIDSVINAETVSFFRKASKLLVSEPSIRAGLTAAEIKTITAFEDRYKSDNSFRAAVDQKVRLSIVDKAVDDAKNASDKSKDHKKVLLDALKKYIDILSSLSSRL